MSENTKTESAKTAKKSGGLMKKLRRTKKKLTRGKSSQGTMTMVMILVAIAIVVFLNLIVGQLPANILQFDVSQRNIYRLSEVSREYAAGLTEDVQFIMLAEPSSIDARIKQFVYSYAALSDHITVTEQDPVQNPSLLVKWSCSNDSLVVYCPATGKHTAIPFNDTGDALIVKSWSTYYNSYTDVAFDGDGQITSALDYVTGDSYGTAYTLTGHGESELASNVTSRITKANVLLGNGSVNIARTGIPGDADLLICYAPTTDLATDELAALRSFLGRGGSLILLMEYVDLPNFNALMQEYGMTLQQGFVYDTTRYYEQFYTSFGYYCMYPQLASKVDITSGVSNSAMIQYPRGMLMTDPARESITLEAFMASSESGVLSDGTNETPGMYYFGLVASEQVTNTAGRPKTAKLTVISATSLIYDGITKNYPSLSNLDIFANAVAYCFNTNNVSIASRSLELTANTVTNYGFWSILFVAVIPLLFLIGGFILWIRRRRS